MQWNNKNTLYFIEVYRGKEILWNTKHPKYYNKLKKNDAWNEIAIKMQTTPEECKKKMKGLLSALRREKAKIKKSRRTGIGLDHVYESSWFAFKSLLFLWNKNKMLDTHLVTIKEEIQDYEMRVSLDNATSNDHDLAAVNTPSPPTQSLSKRKKSAYAETFDDDFKTTPQVTTEEVTESEIFGNLVAKKLQKYSSEAQTSVQQEIMNILFRADNGYYNQLPPHFLLQSSTCTQESLDLP